MKKNNLLYIAFGVLVILVGIFAICTAQTSRTPIRSMLQGIAMIAAGIAVIVFTILEQLQKKK